MAKYAALLIAVALAGCTTYDRTAARGGTAPGTHDVNVQMDRDGSVRTYATDFNLREGDRVQVLADGKVGPL
ncbi:MAG: hypothetical protein E6H57_12845 [Betaproteobacteria bacterium]|nr:MAG: hypothetical protein E6H57_12845 [Betaproteobacteria bacterium]